jgi:hypothetical protein
VARVKCGKGERANTATCSHGLLRLQGRGSSGSAGHWNSPCTAGFPPGLWPQFPCRPRSTEAQPEERLKAYLPLKCPHPWSAGQQEPERPHSGGLYDGHLTNFQLKSLSFLKSLKVCPTPRS